MKIQLTRRQFFQQLKYFICSISFLNFFFNKNAFAQLIPFTFWRHPVASTFTFAFTANATNQNLRTAAIAAGWNGTVKVVATVNSGVTLSGTAGGNSGLTVSGSFPTGVELVIAAGAFIYGGGGNGGVAGTGGPNGFVGGTFPTAGGAGGTGLNVSVAIKVTNNGTIAGGGGAGGASGSIPGPYVSYTGGAGGAGQGPSAAQAGAGPGNAYAGVGGSGGNYGVAGTGGGTAFDPSNMGTITGGAAGAAGNSVNGNSNITWAATGTRTGPVV